MKKIVILITTIILVLGMLYYREFKDYYESGENDSFEINVGQEFRIRLYENGSTGYSNCWLNEKNNALLKIVKKEYSQSLNSRFGYAGSGGLIEITFKGLKVGVDTIKIANCSFRDGQECLDYNAQNTKSDNEFIVEITN